MAQIDESYAVRREERGGVPVVCLRDEARQLEAEIVPGLGNRAIALRLRGENYLYTPSDDPARLREDRHLNGIPFLAPWANRMPEGFWAGGKHYRFDLGSPEIRADEHGIPIHGLLTASRLWEVSECAADANGAQVTSRLDFRQYPQLLKNWPPAHEYEMTHRLAGGVLEIRVAVLNRGAAAMPIAIGFHPYFQLPGVPLAQAFAHIPAGQHVETDARLVATGELRPIRFPERIALGERRFDDGFTALDPEPFWVEGGGKRIEVEFGPKYTAAIVYAPAGRDYICFEPMTAITNGINLAHEGKYAGLQTVAAGATWRESFRVRVF